MAKVVEDFNFKGRGRRQKYPWDEWLDGKTWLLVKGEDFDTSEAVFRGVAQGAARDRGFKLSTSINPEGVYIRAVAR